MKTSKFTDSQIMTILKQAEAGTPVPELCREHGMSSATFYKWRAKFGGMDASLMARLKELEAENVRRRALKGRNYSGSDGATRGGQSECDYPHGLCGILYQPNLLPILAS